MLKPLLITETEDTPRVVLDRQNEIFEITGRSFPEDATKFYSAVLRWVEGYTKDPCEETNFIFYVEYFNSTSLKQLIEIIIRLEEIAAAGKKVKVTWSYAKKDELIAAKGEEIQSMVNLSFELKPME